MIEEQVKEDCDRMSALELKIKVEEVCRENDIPTTGWELWFYNSPGPKCFRRISGGERTHTAYIQSFWLGIFENGGLKPIASGGLT